MLAAIAYISETGGRDSYCSHLQSESGASTPILPLSDPAIPGEGDGIFCGDNHDAREDRRDKKIA